MKRLKSKNLWKAANVEFNADTIEARSYAWWIFVKKINGLVVFNSYKYSVTTAKHQRKLRDLLNDLGIKIDLEVQTPVSLGADHAVSDALQGLFRKHVYAMLKASGSARESTKLTLRSEALDCMNQIDSLVQRLSIKPADVRTARREGMFFAERDFDMERDAAARARGLYSVQS